MRGKTCSVSLFSGKRLFSHPYIKTLFRRECPWMSQYMKTPFSSSKRLSRTLVWYICGKASLSTVQYCRFKSWPSKQHLEFPTMTPSGLSMGMSLKMNRFLRSWTIEHTIYLYMRVLRPCCGISISVRWELHSADQQVKSQAFTRGLVQGESLCRYKVKKGH